MSRVRWAWALVALAACGSFPQPHQEFGVAGDGGADDDALDYQDAGVGFDADPPDAFVPLDGPVIDGAPQGTPPSTGTVSISGTTDAGDTMTVTPSGWSLGSPAGTYHYKWQRCSTSACTSTSTIGTDSTTYTLTASDGGYYIRGGVYASNTCSSGCGQSATVYSSAHGPVRDVVTAKGGACCLSGCCSSACAWVKVSLKGFPSGSHAVKLYGSNVTGAWSSYTTSTFPSERGCWGYPGKKVWSTVDSLKSNTVTW
jgi:hypothetical protein